MLAKEKLVVTGTQKFPIRTSTELIDYCHQHFQFVPKHLGELLVDADVISQQQLKKALDDQKANAKLRIGEVLIDSGIASREQIDIALCQRFGVPFVQLNDFSIEQECLDKIPLYMARRNLVLPLVLDGETLIVCVNDPTNIEMLDMLRFFTGRNLEVAVATKEELESAISFCYEGQQVQEALQNIELPCSIKTNDQSIKELTDEEKKPVVKLVQNIISDAINKRASDIHIRPSETKVNIFLRVDGDLKCHNSFDLRLLPAIVNRIKICSGMDITERRLPQDGRSTVNQGVRKFDLRISIMPTVRGESVVIRVLSSKNLAKSLKDLGFSRSDTIGINHILNRSNGLFLVTGPTGSGKTTTLYSALETLKERDINVITVEDPVEYRMDKVTQIQVNHQLEYGFSKALRHILRHDPDAIMIGEIRDKETANIAIESALTGHIVLSTLHTNDAVSTITRLVEVGIEPYMISSCLLGVLAQRLVKLNCVHCLEVEQVSDVIRDELGVGKEQEFFQSTGCHHCQHSGINGRRTVYELLVLSDDFKKLLNKGGSAAELTSQSLKDGMVALTDNALMLAQQKKVSLQEVYRVRLE